MKRLDRYGRRLMTLASIAQFVTVLGWIYHVLLLAELTGAIGTKAASWAALPLHFFGASIQQLPSVSQGTSFGLYVGVLLPSLVASWWPWFQLRRFGKAFYRHPPLSPAVAHSLQWLGYSLASSAALTFIVTPLATDILTNQQIVSVNVSSLLYVQVVAAICAFSMALIVREAVRISDENKGFV